MVRRLLTRTMAFGGVGLIAFFVDLGVFNLLRATVLGEEVVLAKVASMTIATAVAFLGHRQLTFRDRRDGSLGREIVLFALANLGGLLIAAGCLFVSHDVLGLRSALADNVSGNVIGLVLGTAFRYACYRAFVFRVPATESATD